MAVHRIAFDKAIRKFRGAVDWSPHAVHVPIVAHDTRRMLFVRTAQDHDDPDVFCWPMVGLAHGEVATDGIERALAKIGFCGNERRRDWWQVGFLRFLQARGHVGLLAPLVMVRHEFLPALTYAGDYDGFAWRRALDPSEQLPTMSYALNEVLDHPSSSDHLASVLANVR